MACLLLSILPFVRLDTSVEAIFSALWGLEMVVLENIVIVDVSYFLVLQILNLCTRVPFFFFFFFFITSPSLYAFHSSFHSNLRRHNTDGLFSVPPESIAVISHQ
jgi:hypothetical protein